jgi:hypothetical protein
VLAVVNNDRTLPADGRRRPFVPPQQLLGLRRARHAVGLGMVIRVERGEQFPTLDTVLAVAHALGMSGAALLADCPAWTETPKPKGKRHAPPE